MLVFHGGFFKIGKTVNLHGELFRSEKTETFLQELFKRKSFKMGNTEKVFRWGNIFYEEFFKIGKTI